MKIRYIISIIIMIFIFTISYQDEGHSAEIGWGITLFILCGLSTIQEILQENKKGESPIFYYE